MVSLPTAARIFSVLRVEHGGRDVAAVMADWRSPPVPAPQTARRARSAGPTRAETPSPFTAPGTGRQPAGCDQKHLGGPLCAETSASRI